LTAYRWRSLLEKTYMTHDELVELLAQLEAQEREQSKAGVFNDRLLNKINQVRTLLQEEA